MVILFMLLAFSCKRKQQEVMFEPEKVALPCVISCQTVLSDSVYAFPEAFEGSLYRFLKQTKGKKADLKIPYPEKWQLEAALESPFPGIDLWIVSNPGEITHKLLVTMSVPRVEGEKPEIIDGLWIAYSAANERTNCIESEEWKAEIDAEAVIRVHKKYEVLYSMSDTSHGTDDNRLKEVTDVFHVDYTGVIKYEEPLFTENYRAVIQFMDTAESGLELDDEWVEKTMVMQEYLEPYGICFVEVFQHFDEVLLTNYQGEPVDVVNISPFLKTYGRGFVLVEKGKKPRYVRYGSAVDCLKKAYALWGLNPDLIHVEEEDEENTETLLP